MPLPLPADHADIFSIELLTGQWLLALYWIAYFVLHSLLAEAWVKRRIATHLPAVGRHYRLFYNLLAMLLLAPLAVAIHFNPGPIFWAWAGAGAWFANALALLAVAGIWHSARHYDMPAFLGLAPGAAGRLSLSPWHRHVRHPWYSLGLVIIWTRDMNAATLVSALLITAYLVIGSRLEDERLCSEFGAAYREYRTRVPGIIPWPGRSLSAGEAAAITDGVPRRQS